VLAWIGIGILVLIILVAGTIYTLLHNQRFHDYLLTKAESTLSTSLGTQVKAQNYTLAWSGISPTLDLYNASVAGAAPYTNPPLLTADHLHAEVRITSILSRTWYINDITLDHPVLHLLFDKSGKNNLPTPQKSNSQSKTDLFSLGIRHAQLNSGEVYYNDQKTPLEADLHDLNFQATFDPAATKYSGTLSYRDGHVVMSNYRPIPHEMDAKWSYTREQFALESAALRSGKSNFNLAATVTDFNQPKLDAHYDASLDTGEFRSILKNPSLPTGVVKTSGVLSYQSRPNVPALKLVTLHGEVTSGGLTLTSPSYRGSIRDLRAHYTVANGDAAVPDLHAALLGGTLNGDLKMRDLAGNTHSTLHAALKRVSLADVKTMMNSASLKQVDVRGSADATLDANWGKNTNDLVAKADANLNGGLGRYGTNPIPMNGVVHARYVAASKLVSLQQSYLRTPQSSLNLNGTVGDHSALQVNLQSRDLREIETLANAFRPPAAGEQPLGLAGTASFVGNVTGSTASPRIAGQLNAANLKLRGSTWRVARASLDASPSQVRIQNGELDPADRGHIRFDLRAGLNKWSFTENSPFNVALDAGQLNVADFAALAGKAQGATGTLDAHVTAHGTELNPVGNGTLNLTGAKYSGREIPNLHSAFQANGDRVHATLHADIPHANANATVDYMTKAQDFVAQLAVTGYDLKTSTLLKEDYGLAGIANLAANGRGNIHNPTLEANLSIPQLTVRGQQLNNIQLHSTVANHVANFTLGTQGLNTSLTGHGRVELAGDYNSDIALDTQRIPLGPIAAMLAPSQGGNINGQTELHAVVRGPLKNKQALEAHLNIPVLALQYKNTVQLGATGPIRADYAGGTLTLQPVHIQGTDTDLQARGVIPVVDKNAPVQLLLLGTVDLRLAELIDPEIASGGQLKFNIDSTGARANPDIQGKVQVINATFATGDVPLGLQNGNGVLTLTKDRLNIDQFTGTVGGGQVTATGGVAYRPNIFFSLGVQGRGVRVLYQDAVRTGVDLNLALNGTPQASLLRGQINVDELQFTPDFDLMNFMGSLGGGEATPPPSDSFANNMKLQVGVSSNGGVHLVSRTLSLEGNANLHVVGTGQQPVILGRVNLNGGDLIFQGNRYKLQGGTINFVDINQTKPVMDVAVNTTIQQYDIQMHFWGPADHMHTNYSSDPALPPSDIINLIAFGKTSEASAANPTPPGQLGAESLVASQVSSQITSRVEKFAGISQLSIDPVLGGNQQNPGAHIAIQQRVTSKIFVTFSTDVTSTQNEVIKFEYQVKPRVSVSAVRDQNGGVAVDTRFHKKW
jgi:autotransporter translocation and assembly factor TamB